jgi:transposase
MLSIANHAKIYVYTANVDMRKSINGLIVLLVDIFEQDPKMGDFFVFVNKQRNKLKILFWDKNGFSIYYKRLEKGRFQYSSYLQGEEIVVNPAQLTALLMGLDFYILGQYPDEIYQDFF